MENIENRTFDFVLLILALFGLTLLCYSLSIYVQADDQAHEVDVVNADPTVDSVYVATSAGHGYLPGSAVSTVTPTESTDTQLWIYGIATDNNGCENMDTATDWSVKLYKSGIAATYLCSTDGNDCATITPASDLTFTGCGGAGDLDMYYQAVATLKYWADATDASTFIDRNWVIRVVAGDEDAGTGAGTTTFELASLTAFDVTSNIDYGTLALGATSDAKTVTFAQTGNRRVNLRQTATTDGLVCDEEGSIPFTNVKMADASDFTFSSDGTAMVGTLSSMDYTLNLLPRESEITANTMDKYLKLQVPSSSVRGTCTGTITFAALAATD